MLWTLEWKCIASKSLDIVYNHNIFNYKIQAYDIVDKNGEKHDNNRPNWCDGGQLQLIREVDNMI